MNKTVFHVDAPSVAAADASEISIQVEFRNQMRAHMAAGRQVAKP